MKWIILTFSPPSCCLFINSHLIALYLLHVTSHVEFWSRMIPAKKEFQKLSRVLTYFNHAYGTQSVSSKLGYGTFGIVPPVNHKCFLVSLVSEYPGKLLHKQVVFIGLLFKKRLQGRRLSQPILYFFPLHIEYFFSSQAHCRILLIHCWLLGVSIFLNLDICTPSF